MSFNDLRKKLFSENISKEFENKIFQAVLPELRQNKMRSYRRFSWVLIPTLFAAVVIVSHTRHQMPISGTEMLSVANSEVELYQNLDLIENLDVLESIDDTTMGNSI